MSKRRKIEPELKEQAVSLVLNSQLSQTQISEELGISQSLLSRWVREQRERRENVRLKHECAFLKKVAGYSAHASNPGIK